MPKDLRAAAAKRLSEAGFVWSVDSDFPLDAVMADFAATAVEAERRRIVEIVSGHIDHKAPVTQCIMYMLAEIDALKEDGK